MKSHLITFKPIVEQFQSSPQNFIQKTQTNKKNQHSRSSATHHVTGRHISMTGKVLQQRCDDEKTDMTERCYKGQEDCSPL